MFRIKINDNGSAAGALIKFTLPTVIANLSIAITSLSVIYIIKPLGANFMAAIVAADRVIITLQAIIGAIGSAVTITVAQSHGASNKSQKTREELTGIAWIVGTCFVASVCVLYSSPTILSSLGLDKESFQIALGYLKVIILYFPVYGLLIALFAILRGLGNAIEPMIWSLAGSIAVICVLTLSFQIFKPSAFLIANSIGITYSFICAAIIISNYSKCLDKIKVCKNFINNRSFSKKLLKLAWPILTEQTIQNFVILGFMAFVGTYSSKALAAYGAGILILSLSFIIGISISTTCNAFVGNLVGQKKINSALRFSWQSTLQSVAIMSLIGMLFYFSSGYIASMITDDEQTQSYLSFFISVMAVIQPLMAIEYCIGGALRGSGNSKEPFLFSVAGIFLGRGAFLLLCISLDLSVYWVYCAVVVDWALKALLYINHLSKNGLQSKL